MRRSVSLLLAAGLVGGMFVAAPAVSAKTFYPVYAQVTAQSVTLDITGPNPMTYLNVRVNRAPKQIRSLTCALDELAVPCTLAATSSTPYVSTLYQSDWLPWVAGELHTWHVRVVLTDGNVLTLDY